MPERIEVRHRASGTPYFRFGETPTAAGRQRLLEVRAALSSVLSSNPYTLGLRAQDVDAARYSVDDDELPLADNAPSPGGGG